MPEAWTVEELAAATGEPVDRLVGFAEAGLLLRRADGRYEGDAWSRVQLIRFAREHGVDDGQLAAAVAAQGDLLGIFEGLSTGEVTPYTLAEAAQQVELAGETFTEVARTLGWETSAVASTEDVDALRLLAQAVDTGLEREPLLQLVRVYADLLDRLADAEVRIFHDYVHERFRAAGLSGRELLDATESLGKPLLGLVEPALLYFHRRAWARVNGEDLLRHVLEETAPPSATPGESLATVLFIDLAGFTPMTVAMGDAAAADVLRRFAAMVRDCTATHRGRIIKQIGDAFMLTFTRPDDAVRFGLDILVRVAGESQFPTVHVGAHHGAVLYRDGDYVGAAVNLAARVASVSGAGQFLITEAARDAVDEIQDAVFSALPPRNLKGVPDPVPLVDVRPSSADEQDLQRDPVCQMRLHPSDVMAVRTWQGRSYVFCSHECAQAFDATPDKYASS
jgi:adenylate cyclase